MAKKKNKAVIRPWCWYCEREFEDEKVLMQHQKAKHFKCKMCPRRLNTAGGLAVHIQQVHKLEPDNLPRIENALPGRDGYEVEIFGMEGIPAPDVADYKRRKEIELGLNPGTISQPQAKRPKIENRIFTQAELKAQLEAHKALMGASDVAVAPQPTADAGGGAVYNAAPQTYTASPMPAGNTPNPSGLPPGAPPFLPLGPPPAGFPGPAPFPPFPGMPGFPPGPPPPGFNPSLIPPGLPPFPAGITPPPFLSNTPIPPVQSAASLPLPVSNGAAPLGPASTAEAIASVPISSATQATSHSVDSHAPELSAQPVQSATVTKTPSKPPIPDPRLKQENPVLKEGQVLKYTDANYCVEENRAYHARYFNTVDVDVKMAEESRGKKRARAEDFL